MAMAASPLRRRVPSPPQHVSPSDRIRIHAFELLEVADMMDSPALSIEVADQRIDMVEQISADVRAVVRGRC